MKRRIPSLISQDSYDKSVLLHLSMGEAERSILIFVQQQEFATKINALASENSLVDRRSRIRNLDPFLDVGILRVGGRLH